ncbi:hypothetical protein BDM02DRAFT_3132696 [Thelephora ganbajun]|uniref:Uncharacterized protein n=1 Tax=Thelephora ganbajun TaxID=370292 RepID=A0ACB6Z0I2_THEGA|nr:hypothetical protein BDM02DRAFT_3132696 [Thelephora ganbajun]
MLASSLDLVTVAHNKRLGRLESCCFEQERELGEMRVRMLELELAWERMEFQALSLGYVSAGGGEVALVGEGIEEERVEEEVGMDEEGLWSLNSSDHAVLALVPDSSAFPTQGTHIHPYPPPSSVWMRANTTKNCDEDFSDLGVNNFMLSHKVTAHRSVFACSLLERGMYHAMEGIKVYNGPIEVSMGVRNRMV